MIKQSFVKWIKNLFKVKAIDNPVTGLKFEDFKGTYLDDKTKVTETKPGVYVFESEFIDYETL